MTPESACSGALNPMSSRDLYPAAAAPAGIEVVVPEPDDAAAPSVLDPAPEATLKEGAA